MFMGTLEIVLIMIGAVLCVASFVIPVKKEELNEDMKTALDEEAKKMVEREVDSVRSKVDGITDETIQYAIEKAERSMERVSNEKIMAVSEYSDTVLEEIRKNHQEVVFLYDMLNDKQENVKSTVAETNRSLQNIIEKANDAKADLKMDLEDLEEQQQTKEKTVSAEDKSSEKPDEKAGFAPFVPVQITREEAKEAELQKESRIAQVKAEMEEMMKAAREANGETEAPREDTAGVAKKEELPESLEEIPLEEMYTEEVNDQERMNSRADIQLTGGDQDETGNNNEKILKMHKAGKSNMAIAKELGLGIGEVKLVIDLFQ